jgi:hypothetical protein
MSSLQVNYYTTERKLEGFQIRFIWGETRYFETRDKTDTEISDLLENILSDQYYSCIENTNLYGAAPVVLADIIQKVSLYYQILPRDGADTQLSHDFIYRPGPRQNGQGNENFTPRIVLNTGPLDDNTTSDLMERSENIIMRVPTLWRP